MEFFILELTCMTAVLADGSSLPTDPIAGWSNLTAFGALLAVIGWIGFKLLPSKDAQMEKLIAASALAMAAKDEQMRITIKDIIAGNQIALEAIRQDEERRLAQVLSFNRDQTANIMTLVTKELEILSATQVRLGDEIKVLASILGNLRSERGGQRASVTAPK